MHQRRSGVKLWMCLFVFFMGHVLLDSWAYGQTSPQDVLQGLVDESSLAVWGQVVQSDSYWQTDERGAHIYTAVHIIPLSGTYQEELVLEVTGGTVGEITETVSNSPFFYVGQEVVVFLTEAPHSLINGPFGALEVMDGLVWWGGHGYPVETFLDGLVMMRAGTLPDSFWAPRPRASRFTTLAGTPVISGISPNKASAGTNSEVTITGSHFGATQGSSKVEFYYRSGSRKSARILSWSDTQIRCTVPESAGSGPVTVTTGDGTSNQMLFRVTFGYGGVKWPGTSPTVAYWVNENTSDTTGEADAVRRAAGTWNSAGPLTFQYQGSHTRTTSSHNSKNEIMWGSTGSLAVAIVWSSGSSIVECDMIFNDSFDWSASGSPGAQEVDVETVALHEFGHFLNLSDLYGDVGDGNYDVDKVMYGLTLVGGTKRSLRSDDRAGVNWIYASSSPCTTPSAPGNVTATDGTYCDKVRVTWTSVSGATEYEIWRNTSNDSGSAGRIANDSTSPYHDTSATPDTTYYYWVKTKNACGTSGFSISDSGVRSIQTPAVPNGVSAGNGAYCDRIRLSWEAVPGATEYEIWRNTGNSAASAIKLTDDTASPYYDTSANPNTIYYYWVKAKTTCGTSDFSAPDTGYRSSTTAAPANVFASDGVYVDRVRITWDAVPGATGYEIWRGPNRSSNFAVKLDDDSASPYNDRSLTDGARYYYWVKAKGPCGASGFGDHDVGYLNEYRLTLSSSVGGSVIQPGEGTFDYVKGAAVAITAHPDKGYWFVRWSGSAVNVGLVSDPESATTRININGNHTLKAVFQRIEVHSTLYVDRLAPAGNDGRSWSGALVHLQDALSLARSFDGRVGEIRVAQGIYRPDRGVDVERGDRNAAFQLLPGIHLKGGYAGLTASDPNARDVELYPTVLSGDLDGDDIMLFDPNELPAEPSRADNSMHIVRTDGTDANTVLDGFVLSGAHGSENGGAVVNQAGHPTIIQCTFTGNSSRRGGGLYNQGGHPRLYRCRFIGNYAGHSGAGIHNHALGYPDVNDCVFVGNVAGSGAGIANTDGSSAYITRCTFNRNHAFRYGGGIQDANDCLSILRNCLLTGNEADLYGGAVHYVDDCQADVYHCTFADNRAGEGGSAVGTTSRHRPSAVNFVNCIFWNEGLELTLEDGSDITVTFSNIRTGWPGEGNIDLNPQFVKSLKQDDGGSDNDLWRQGDYHLLPDSPCIDAGSPDYVPQSNETDLDGTGRIMNGRIDMGAYEFSPAEG